MQVRTPGSSGPQLWSLLTATRRGSWGRPESEGEARARHPRLKEALGQTPGVEENAFSGRKPVRLAGSKQLLVPALSQWLGQILETPGRVCSLHPTLPFFMTLPRDFFWLPLSFNLRALSQTRQMPKVKP